MHHIKRFISPLDLVFGILLYIGEFISKSLCDSHKDLLSFTQSTQQKTPYFAISISFFSVHGLRKNTFSLFNVLGTKVENKPPCEPCH